MKRKLHVSIPTQNPWSIIGAGFMAAAVIIRLLRYLPEVGSISIWVPLVLPVSAGVVFLLGMIIGGKWAKIAAMSATFLGVLFFILKATGFTPIHQTLCTILYITVLLLFTGTLLGLFPSKKLLYPLFGLPLIYHILVEDTQLYFFAETPFSFWAFMPELSVLCIMAGLLCLSIGLETEKITDDARN